MVNGDGTKQNRLAQTAELVKNKGAVQQLLRSEDTKRMMELLNRQGAVQGAAKAAAAGDPAELMGMMERLMSTEEGTQLVERIARQAKQSGL